MSASARLVAAMLAFASVTVLGSAFAVTQALADGAPPSLRLPFRLICHGLADRCFVIGGSAMPICARCTAIWGGLLLGTALFALLWRSIRDVPLGALAVANLLHFIDLWPLQWDRVRELLDEAHTLVLVEQNFTAQLGHVIRTYTGKTMDKTILKYDGRPISADEIVAGVRGEVRAEVKVNA